MTTEAKPKKPFYKRWWFITICVLFLIGVFMPKDKTTTADGRKINTVSGPIEPTEQSMPVAETERSGMTLKKYQLIKNGMKKSDVESAIGMPGESMSEAGEGEYRMEIVSYKADNGIANASVTYTNGKVSGKAQLGLE